MPKPRFMYYHDGRHPHIYRYEPPMLKEEYWACIDELVGTPIDAVSFCLGEGRTVLHDTKVGELLGHNVAQWDHPVFRRAYQNAKHLIDEGNDPMRLVCERAHHRGMSLYGCLLIQNPGPENCTVRCSDFRHNNPHLEIRAAGDLGPDTLWIDGLDFKHPEVRDERFNLIEETLNEYDTDGFELQFNFLPRFFHPNEVDVGVKIMTEWVARVYEAVKKSGSDHELVVRVPIDFPTSLSVGLDVAEWIKRGIVDVVVPELFTGPHRVDPNLDFTPMLAAARSADCRILPALHSRVGSDRIAEGPIEMIRAQACNYWAQGIDGLYICQWFHHWPFEADFYERLRELPYPDLMANKDKYYYIPSTLGAHLETHSPPLLPVRCEVGKPTEVNFAISDDLPRWHAAGRVHDVLLRIGVSGNTELDRVTFKLNSKELTGARRINQLYRMDAPRHRTGPSYWHIFRPDPDTWPIKGRNTLTVELHQRDTAMLGDVSLSDVELEIKYLKGKHFQRGYVDSDLGYYEYSSM